MQFDKSKHVFHIYGMRRTGNHAVINWLMQGTTGSILFCNDLNENDLPTDSVTKRFKPGVGTSNIIASYEDVKVDGRSWNIPPSVYGAYQQQYQILILRDPFNLLASRYVWKFAEGKQFREDKRYRERIIALWKENARAFLRWKSEAHPERVPVNYNFWTYRPDYREQLAAQLNMRHAHRGMYDVKEFGGGSSFEGTLVRPKKQERHLAQNRYTTRFKVLLENPNYRAIFTDSELLELSKQIFGTIPGTQELFPRQ